MLVTCPGINTGIVNNSFRINYSASNPPCIRSNTLLAHSIGSFDLNVIINNSNVTFSPVPVRFGARPYFSITFAYNPAPRVLIARQIERDIIRIEMELVIQFIIKIIGYPIVYVLNIPKNISEINNIITSVEVNERFTVVSNQNVNADINSDIVVEDNIVIDNDNDINTLSSLTNSNSEEIVVSQNIQFNIPSGKSNPRINKLSMPIIIIKSIIAEEFILSEFNFIIYDFDKYIYKTKITRRPQIQFVLKGPQRGTLVEKINYLLEKFNIDFDFGNFLFLLAFYSAVRYILSALLYHDFDVKYLLDTYYCSFLFDLNNSRFFRFLEFFVVHQKVILDEQEVEVDFSVFHKYFLSNFNSHDICRLNGNTRGCIIKINEKTT